MVPAGARAENGPVGLVRDPGQRMPLAWSVDAEIPPQIFAIKLGDDMRVFEHVHVVVEIDELKSGSLPINCADDQQQSEACCEGPPQMRWPLVAGVIHSELQANACYKGVGVDGLYTIQPIRKTRFHGSIRMGALRHSALT